MLLISLITAVAIFVEGRFFFSEPLRVVTTSLTNKKCKLIGIVNCLLNFVLYLYIFLSLQCLNQRNNKIKYDVKKR